MFCCDSSDLLFLWITLEFSAHFVLFSSNRIKPTPCKNAVLISLFDSKVQSAGELVIGMELMCTWSF